MKVRAIFAALCVNVGAHMAIQVPPPIPGSDSKSPLDATGDNFPCQNPASLTAGTVTNLVAGSSQSLQFNLGQGANTAVHGGGSCQISVTYSTDPTSMKDPSNWKVLHSFIGGCPTEAPGNLNTAVACPGDTDGTNCVDQSFTFNVPNEVQNGNAILAWTWFNNIGNREMYMNCANVAITGGTNQMDDLPAMFVANVGNNCATTEQFNTDFPNPGQYVTTSALNYPLKAPVGAGCQTGPGSGNSTTTPVTPAVSPAASPASAQTSTAGGAFAEGASSVAAAPAAATTLATVASAAPSTPTTVPAAAPAAPANGSGSCTDGQVACSASGFYCIDTSTFGMCAFGCATPMAVAAGTSCTNGAIGFAKEKRHPHIRHARRNLLSLE
jgi:hypothetical protein